jgi:hypothetical protein
MERRKTCGLAGLAAICLVSGCAFGTRNVDLRYDSYPIEAAAKGKVALGEVREGVQKNKQGKPKIGIVRNGYGWETAEVLANNSPAEWLREALGKELKNLGYEVVKDNSIVINGELTYLFTDISMAYQTNVSFKIAIERKGKRVYVDAFNGASRNEAWFATAQEYGKASTDALKNAMMSAMPKIKAELEKLAGEKD